jgi:hypothetical protein
MSLPEPRTTLLPPWRQTMSRLNATLFKGLLVWLELLLTIGLLVAWIVACVQAFQHKSGYPKLFVSLSAITLLLSCIDLYIAATIFHIPIEPKEIMWPLLMLLIWGPYMFLSKRVRNTFTR